MLDWKKLILYPAAIYAVVFLFISALIGFKIDAKADWVMIATTLISVVGLYIASRAAKVDSLGKAAILGLSWVLVLFILDLVLTRQYVPNYFASWKSYLPYVLSFVMPLIFARK